MKKLLPLVLVALLVAFTMPAIAANVDANVYVYELFAKADLILKAKADLELKVVVDCYVTKIDETFKPNGRVMSQVVKSQINEDSSFCLYDPKYSDLIEKSFNNFNGIGQANQAAGSMVNQANVVSVAVASKDAAWASSEVIDFQLNDGCGFDPDPTRANFADKIDGSFNDFKGIGQANQSAGMANNQNNVVSIAASKGVMVAESDVRLQQVNVNNGLYDSNIVRTNTITGSFNSFKGIGQVNQSAGSFNNQSNVVSVVAATR